MKLVFIEKGDDYFLIFVHYLNNSMSKASLIRIKHSLTTLDVANDEIPEFYNPLHYHPELELTLVEQSTGTRIVGDSLEPFSAGDLVLVGPNTPHIWKNHVKYDEEGNLISAKAVVIKFLPEFAGTPFLDIPEMKKIKEILYGTSLRGIKLEGRLRDQVEEKMKMFVNMSSSERIIRLLEVLLLISQSEEYRLLSRLPMYNSSNKKDDRINQILSFLQTFYSKPLHLDVIADKICMHKNSLCGFFKQKTGKTIFEVLHEIRIKRACFLLNTSNDSIEVIASKVGYASQSLFNRKFKKICKMTPVSYRKAWNNANKY